MSTSRHPRSAVTAPDLNLRNRTLLARKWLPATVSRPCISAGKLHFGRGGVNYGKPPYPPVKPMATPPPNKPYFARPELAAAVADELLRPSLFGQTPPGLFLAAPRRTGKSTFLYRDLKPALEAAGALVLYVDLWANQDVSPTQLISSEIARSLADHQGAVRRAAAAVGLRKVSIKGIEFEVEAVGAKAGASIADALGELHRLTQKPIVLIVDEAQHTVKKGETQVMFALKAARDAVNMTGHNLVLVMSGSDRDKLLRLVHGKHAPFYGADINDLPELGAEYVAYAAGALASVNPQLVIDNSRLSAAFDDFSHRPEPFGRAISQAASPLEGPPEEFNDRVSQMASSYKRERDTEMDGVYLGLSDLQRAVVAWLLSNPGAGMFTGAALRYYSDAVKRDVQAGSARDAIEALRAMEPPILWKSERGEYRFEDSAFIEWYARRTQAKEWPPT